MAGSRIPNREYLWLDQKNRELVEKIIQNCPTFLGVVEGKKEKSIKLNTALSVSQTGPLALDAIGDCAFAQINWFRPYKDVPFVIHTERMSSRETARELVSNETAPIEIRGFDSFYDASALRIVNCDPKVCLNQMACDGMDFNPYIRETLSQILTSVDDGFFSLLKGEGLPLVVVGDQVMISAMAYAFAKTYSRWLSTIIEMVPPPVSGILVMPTEIPGVRRLIYRPVAVS